ncbi:hypothetical protein [Marivirga tractuosa]|nr:hypothetical protein [Marivirga tractuosa]
MTNINYVDIMIILCCISIFVLAIVKTIKISKTDKPDTVGLFSIWLFGLFAFLLGLIEQTLNMISVFDAVAASGDINPSIIAEGASDSTKGAVTGIWILIVSLILWGTVKGLKNWKIRKSKSAH